MNFLAHLWLAEQSATSMAGAILGDVVRGADLSAYPDDIVTGIRLHRRLDAFTDRHPHIAALRNAQPDGVRRYSGIVLDLVADYLLIEDWPRYASEPLPAFCARAGEAIERASEWFLLAGGRSSRADDFAKLLLSYGTTAGIERAIGRTAQRLRQPQPLLDAGRHWPQLADALRPQLPELLHDLRAAALAAINP